MSNHQPIVGILPQPCSSGNRQDMIISCFSIISFVKFDGSYGWMGGVKLWKKDESSILLGCLTSFYICRVLIAYESGLIVLWNVVEGHPVVVRGDKVLELQNKVVPPNERDIDIVNDEASLDLEEKEISALCWASTDGSILAMGYVDGDILFWNTSNDSSIKYQEAGLSPNVVKLQLSTSEKRLPVIVLHWLDNSKSSKHREGQLLIYGGDEIGSEEVVTVGYRLNS